MESGLHIPACFFFYLAGLSGKRCCLSSSLIAEAVGMKYCLASLEYFFFCLYVLIVVQDCRHYLAATADEGHYF